MRSDRSADQASLPFRDRDRDVVPVTSFHRAEDVLEAMLQSIDGGEFHLRPTLEADAQSPLRTYVEIGVALRRCCADRSRHGYLVQRLKPHRRGVIDCSLLR
jgi:hypothetical protein